MTLTDARIADRVVADEYASVHAHIDALDGQIPTGALPVDVETAAMTPLRHQAHTRMLGKRRKRGARHRLWSVRSPAQRPSDCRQR